MILLLLSALLFLLLTIPIGFYFSKRREDNGFSFFKSVLTGAAIVTVYLNIFSIFFKTNYWLLLPLSAFSIYVLIKTSLPRLFVISLKQDIQLFLLNPNAVVTLSFLLPLLLFTFVPPYNTDSGGYHFLSILWNEKYRAVPGLANLFPQYGYNSSFFVLNAAFSFTDLFGQSVYAINSVLTIAFLLWILKKSFGCNDVRRLLIWMFLIVVLRQFPINLASPSADALASILVFYIFFSLPEISSKTWQPKEWNHILLLACFAIVIKLSCVPLLLIGIIPLVIYKNRKSILHSYLKLSPAVLIIIVPWLVRNIILSGYLLYPFPAIDLFSVDWKVPLDVVMAEKLHISHAPRLISTDFNYVQSLHFIQWFPTFIQKLWNLNHFNFSLTIVSLLTPIVVSILCSRRKIRSLYFYAWLTFYVAIWFWVITSPDIRFGYHYMLPCILVPLFAYTESKSYGLKQWIKNFIAPAMIFAACIYYDYLALKMLQPYQPNEWLVRPLRSPEYFKNNDLSSFRYVLLNNGVKLYIHDSTHHSINAPLPSCSPYRKWIEMRGSKIEDGFKTSP